MDEAFRELTTALEDDNMELNAGKNKSQASTALVGKPGKREEGWPSRWQRTWACVTMPRDPPTPT